MARPKRFELLPPRFVVWAENVEIVGARSRKRAVLRRTEDGWLIEARDTGGDFVADGLIGRYPAGLASTASRLRR